MGYIGRWVFHSIGAMDEDGQLMYMGAEEYLASPMPYVDTTDPQAVADEMKDRKQTVGSQLAVCGNGELLMLMPLPEGVSQAEVNAAVEAGHIRLYDGMMTDDPKHWQERNGELWLEVGLGMSNDGWVRLSEDNGLLGFMTTRYIKAE